MCSKEIWLWILMVMQPFNPRTHEILALCDGDAERTARFIRDNDSPLVSEKEKRSAKSVHSGDVSRVIAQCENNGIRIITLDDEEYPARLRAIFNPPIVLFVKGSLEGLNNEVTLSVIGARNCDKYSVDITRNICAKLAQLGTVIVSGCAVGIDAAAHSATVNAGGRTIGVLACGQLVDYPAENAPLKKKILETGGALISELLPHSQTFAAYFQQRNRMISGLSAGTLIVEASSHSGCLLTAEHTIEQGRDLFCIPPRDITSAKYAGVIPLLRDGAIPVFSYIDIVNEYIFGYMHGACSDRMLSRLSKKNGGFRLEDPHEKPAAKPSKPQKPAKRPAEEAPAPAEQSAPAALSEEVLSSLDPNEAMILRLIAESPQNIDVITDRSGMSFIDVTSALTDLELFGYAERLMNGDYAVKAEATATKDE